MKSQRPYFFDAVYRWVLDNQCTPYLLVDTQSDSVQVPMHLVKNNQIVLNIVPSAIMNFHVEEEGVFFSARFSGKSEDIYVPFSSMLSLFAKENGEGIIFPAETNIAQGVVKNSKTEDKHQKPKLRISVTEERSSKSESSTSPQSPLKNKSPIKKPKLKIIK